jgi:hypothetical protein
MEIDGKDDIAMPKNGSNNSILNKRKYHEAEDCLEETINLTKDYVKYFPKYLTSYALFDKEVCNYSLKRN